MLSRIIMDPENIDIRDIFDSLCNFEYYDEIFDNRNDSEFIKLLFNHSQLIIDVYYYSDILLKESRKFLVPLYE